MEKSAGCTSRLECGSSGTVDVGGGREIRGKVGSGGPSEVNISRTHVG